jgi:hypothetical protein
LSTPIVPPDTVAAGQTGHVQAHNEISDALSWLVSRSEALPVMSWGKASLTAGSVSVSLPAVGSGSVVLVSRMTPSGTLGHLSVPSVTPGTGFTITSSSSGDASLVGYLVLG